MLARSLLSTLLAILIGDALSTPDGKPVGCFKDNTNGVRDLNSARHEVGTRVACNTLCSDFKYFGLQWANECFCGNSHGSQGRETGGCSGCGTSEACTNRNDVYEVEVPRFLGCYKDKAARDMAFGGVQFESNLVIACNDYCFNQGKRYMGMQYSTYCFCDNDYGTYGQMADNDCDGCDKKSPPCPWRNAVHEVLGFPSNSPTKSGSRTKTPSRTPTRTRTRTPSKSRTPSRTPSRTRTPTRTRTQTPTRSRTTTPSQTPTQTPSQTPTISVPPSPSASSSVTSSQTPTTSVSPTQTPTRTPTITMSSSRSQTATRSSTITPSQTATCTPSPTPTRSPTRSRTNTRTQTPTSSPTRTFTRTATNTRSPSRTRTRTATPPYQIDVVARAVINELDDDSPTSDAAFLMMDKDASQAGINFGFNAQAKVLSQVVGSVMDKLDSRQRLRRLGGIENRINSIQSRMKDLDGTEMDVAQKQVKQLEDAVDDFVAPRTNVLSPLARMPDAELDPTGEELATLEADISDMNSL